MPAMVFLVTLALSMSYVAFRLSQDFFFWFTETLDHPVVRMLVLVLCIVLVIAEEIDGKEKREFERMKHRARFAPKTTTCRENHRLVRLEGGEGRGYRASKEIGCVERTISERFVEEEPPSAP